MVNLKDIEQAQQEIARYIKQTPLTRSQFLSDLCSGSVYLKLENQQVTQSFKVRGVMNKLLHLSPQEKSQGVITASAGNHGKAVAFGAQKLGFKAIVVVPTSTPTVMTDGIAVFSYR
jgi:threonine dehydratase